MQPLPERHTVSFAETLEPGTRVIWIATGVKGTVQPDKAILWDDGTRMSTQQMTPSHAVLIHREPEWLRVHDALSSMLDCVKRGCTLDRWSTSECKIDHPEDRCPLAVLSEPHELQVVANPLCAIGSIPLDTPRRRHRARA
jgi:hypothetical protein